jgi:hypothetical protein
LSASQPTAWPSVPVASEMQELRMQLIVNWFATGLPEIFPDSILMHNAVFFYSFVGRVSTFSRQIQVLFTAHESLCASC